MKITIVKPDNYVVVDGVQKEMDLTFLPDDFHALQWHDESGTVESTNIDNCQKLQNISDWSLWSDFNARLLEAKDVNADDCSVELSDEMEPSPEEPPPTDEEMLSNIRQQRNSYLILTDVDIIRLLESGQPIPADIKEFRQALRDLPNQIESGTVPRPVWNSETQLIEFNYWPVKP